MTRYDQPRTPAARTAGSDVMSGVYTCPELGRTCMRRGAYDALEFPSRFGNELRHADGRVLDVASRDAASQPGPSIHPIRTP